jgi:hypothetical protein
MPGLHQAFRQYSIFKKKEIMKATLYFRLDDPEDIQAHMRCTKATDMALALYRLKNVIHKAIDESEDGKHVDGDYLSNEVNEIFEEFSINLNELIS